MRTKKYCLSTLMIVMLMLNLCACGTNENATFNGSKTANEEHFDIDFDILNTTYTHNLDLKEGDRIAVTVEKESGMISLLIQKEGQDAVYRGEDVEAGAFEVIINEPGTYALSITGEKAQGHVVFTKKASSGES